MATTYQLTKNNTIVTASRLTGVAVKKTVKLAKDAYRWEIVLHVNGRKFGVYFTNGYKYREYRIREHLDASSPWDKSFREKRVDTADEAVNFILNLF